MLGMHGGSSAASSHLSNLNFCFLVGDHGGEGGRPIPPWYSPCIYIYRAKSNIFYHLRKARGGGSLPLEVV